MTADLEASRVVEAARTVLPTTYGLFAAVGYFDLLTGEEHLALISPLGMGSAEAPPTPTNAAYLRAKRDRLGHRLPRDRSPA